MRATHAIALALAIAAPPALAAQLAPAISNPIGMQLVLVQPGTLRVGVFQPACPTPPAPPAAPPAGQPARTPPDPRSQWSAEDYARCAEMVRREASTGFVVSIPRAFYIGKYEVTQGEWKRVMGSNPSTFQGSRVTDDADRHPVENVTWEQAQAFIRRLNEMEPGARYRLPTEFEWEYAARAGAPEDGLSWTAAREQAQTGRATTFMVGQKKPNAWGLHDVYGNVWEWVQDWYNGRTFPDPTPPRTGTVHVLKGASFVGDVKNLTWTTHGAGPGNGWDVGFRVVREVR